MIGAAVCGFPAVAALGNVGGIKQEGVGWARKAKQHCIQPSPVQSNTTAAHDRLGGVLAVIATKQKEQPHA